jgi:hypothetical protein
MGRRDPGSARPGAARAIPYWPPSGAAPSLRAALRCALLAPLGRLAPLYLRVRSPPPTPADARGRGGADVAQNWPSCPLTSDD